MCANTAVNSFVLKGHTSFDVFIIITLCCRSAGAANMHKSWTHDECKAAIHQHKYYERTEPNKSAVCRRTNARLQDAMNNVDCFCFYFSIWCFFYFNFFFFFSLWRLNSVFFCQISGRDRYQMLNSLVCLICVFLFFTFNYFAVKKKDYHLIILLHALWNTFKLTLELSKIDESMKWKQINAPHFHLMQNGSMS